MSELFIPLYAFSAIFPVLALILSFISAIFEAFCFFSRKVKIIIWKMQSFSVFFIGIFFIGVFCHADFANDADSSWDKIPMKFKMGSEYPHYYRHES